MDFLGDSTEGKVDIGSHPEFKKRRTSAAQHDSMQEDKRNGLNTIKDKGIVATWESLNTQVEFLEQLVLDFQIGKQDPKSMGTTEGETCRRLEEAREQRELFADTLEPAEIELLGTYINRSNNSESNVKSDQSTENADRISTTNPFEPQLRILGKCIMHMKASVVREKQQMLKVELDADETILSYIGRAHESPSKIKVPVQEFKKSIEVRKDLMRRLDDRARYLMGYTHIETSVMDRIMSCVPRLEKQGFSFIFQRFTLGDGKKDPFTFSCQVVAKTPSSGRTHVFESTRATSPRSADTVAVFLVLRNLVYDYDVRIEDIGTGRILPLLPGARDPFEDEKLK